MYIFVLFFQGKDANSSNLKLEPLVTKSVLTPRKNIYSLMKSQHHKDVTFPPISCKYFCDKIF